MDQRPEVNAEKRQQTPALSSGVQFKTKRNTMLFIKAAKQSTRHTVKYVNPLKGRCVK